MGKPSKTRAIKGEGSWGKRTINGVEYVTFRKKYAGMSTHKTFYGRTQSEVKQKRKVFEESTNNFTPKEMRKMILYDYILNWLRNVKSTQIKSSAYDTIEDTLNYYIKPYDIGDMQLGSLSSDVIQKHYRFLANNYSLSTIKKTHSLLKQVFDYAIIKKDITVNPLDVVEVPTEKAVSVKKKDIQFLTNEDMQKLVDEADRLNTVEYRVNGAIGTRVYNSNNAYICIFILYTGLRIGECLALRYRDINFDKNIINVKLTSTIIKERDKNLELTGNNIIRETTPKTANSVRVIPLSKTAKWALDKLMELNPHEKDDYIAVSINNNRPSERTITRTLHAMLARSGCDVNVSGFSLHKLRHSFGSYLIRNGVDIKVVSSILGHSKVSTTYDIYIHVMEEQKMQAVNFQDF